jgi:hypothetical protein
LPVSFFLYLLLTAPALIIIYFLQVVSQYRININIPMTGNGLLIPVIFMILILFISGYLIEKKKSAIIILFVILEFIWFILGRRLGLN